MGGAWPNLAALVTLCGGHEVSNAWKSMGQWRRIPVGWPLAGESWTGSACRSGAVDTVITAMVSSECSSTGMYVMWNSGYVECKLCGI